MRRHTEPTPPLRFLIAPRLAVAVSLLTALGCDDPDAGSGDDMADSGTDGGEVPCNLFDLGEAPMTLFTGVLTAANGNRFADPCGAFDGPDMGFEWVAPTTERYRASLLTDLGSSLSVRQTDGCDGEVLACDAVGGSPSVELDAVAGQRYVFVVDADANEELFDFDLRPVDNAAGMCPDFVVDALPFYASGSTVGGVDELAAACGGELSPERTFAFVPPESGTYAVSTLGSTFDTALYVLDGECSGPIVHCNDDFVDSLQSYLAVELVAGQTYTIVVDGYYAETGNYELSIERLQ